MCANTIESIPLLTINEKMYTDRAAKKNCPLFLRPDEKIRAVLKTLVDKYSYPGDFMLDPFPGSLATKHNACLCGSIAGLWYLTSAGNASEMDSRSCSKCFNAYFIPGGK